MTGLIEDELWQKGFNLDDWEIGFQSEVKLHKTPTKKDIENGYRENEEALLYSSSRIIWLKMATRRHFLDCGYTMKFAIKG